jgi:leucyl aminopeptidase
VSEVPNVLYPESYAERIVDALDPLGIDVEVIGEREMRNLGMGALLGVGQGSARESKLVVMKYQGGASDQDPVCFVGKGVTFDTGGISLKPAPGMEDMKYDMGGSAAVVGAMKALALRSAKVNAVGIVGLVENMPGGNAQRPGDVVTTMSGQTAEVLNTDAEGRLVLCDCIWYLQENFKPDCIIDLATLTGAIVVSLGHTYAGLFANDDDLAEKLTKSSLKTNEKLWRMPLHKDYDAMIKSQVADVANIGDTKGAAGSATAAHFIGRFIKDGAKWAHLDIAGMAWDKKGNNPICPKGAIGFGVRLLNQFVKDHYE